MHLGKSASTGHLLKDGTSGHLLGCIEQCLSDCDECDTIYTLVLSGLTGDCAWYNGSYTISNSGAGCSYGHGGGEVHITVSCVIVSGMRRGAFAPSFRQPWSARSIPNATDRAPT